MKKNIVERAKKYAIRKHINTNYSFNGEPYEVYLQMIYDVAEKYKHLIKEDGTKNTMNIIYSSCWLYGLMEYCRTPYHEIKSVFGSDIADIVYALTPNKWKSRKDRFNHRYYKEIRETLHADYVKLCITIADVKYYNKNNKGFFNNFRKGYKYFKQKLFSPQLSKMFEDLEELLKIEIK